ncbi:thioredoxin family protein [Candidatus Parcubacteria bacterium]|nr:thioredoxin family protein [Candidatus Parcubacteria bacterium]
MNKKRYIYTFIITLAIFFFSIWLSNVFGDKKVQSLRDLESRINLDILSVETRFSLLQKTSCEHIVDNKDSDIGFNVDLNNVALKIKSLENQLGYENDDVISLKKYYSLLQIKDYLLAKEFHDRCKKNTVSILYFYDTDCQDCAKQSIILDKIISDYPEIRVYYLDKKSDNPALDTLSSIFKITQSPTLVINEKTFTGFQDVAKIESYIPEIKLWKAAKSNTATTTGTTTKATSTKKR